jgi:MFS family permease
MQSAYAIGEAIAALVVAVVLPHFGWRTVFFVGVLPALLVLWIRSSVPEPALWADRVALPGRGTPRKPVPRGVWRTGLLATAMNACTLFGYWGLFT